MASAKFKYICPDMKKPPLVRQLRLFIDDRGLLRCGVWIHNASLSELARFPYLLPQNNHLTALIVNHVTCIPFSPMQVLASLRQSFWIPSPGLNMSRSCYVNVLPVGEIAEDRMPPQNHLHSQGSESKMSHLSPSLVWISLKPSW